MTNSTIQYSPNQTQEQTANIDRVIEYKTVAYGPRRGSGQAIAHRCGP
jgi:hypothetical protein